MALLTVQQMDSDGVAVTYAAAAAGGDTAPFTGDLKFIVKNGGGAPINVTITAVQPCSFGVVHAAHDKVVAVAAGAEKHIPVDDARYANASGIAEIEYSAVTSVTVAAVRG